MEISVSQGGKFTFTIKAKELSQGLRPTKQNPRDADHLVICKGAVGKNGVLQVTDELVRMATELIIDDFPFPQIFVFTNMIIVCGLTKIYEWDGTALHLKYTTEVPGGTWSAVDFYNYVYMSNGKIAVVRDVGSYEYTATPLLPSASAICNYNGQVIIGSPDINKLELELSLIAPPIEVDTSIFGEMVT